MVNARFDVDYNNLINTLQDFNVLQLQAWFLGDFKIKQASDLGPAAPRPLATLAPTPALARVPTSSA